MSLAVITGSTQGIGKAIAEYLLEQRFLLAVCARNQQKLEQLQMEWEQKFPDSNILSVCADLSTAEGNKKFADAITERYQEVEIIVNNAGSYQPGNISDEPEGLLEKMINVNLFSAYRLTRSLLPLMIKQARGHIFNMCSIASLRAYPNGGAYSISKYALMGFSENLREELMPHGIKVTALCPGAVFTPSWDGSGVNPERIIEANDIAKIVWSTYNLSKQANVDTIVIRPVKGDL